MQKNAELTLRSNVKGANKMCYKPRVRKANKHPRVKIIKKEKREK